MESSARTRPGDTPKTLVTPARWTARGRLESRTGSARSASGPVREATRVKATSADGLRVPDVTERHPLLHLLLEAAAGRFPPPDGTVEVLPSPPGPSDAVVAFTAHSVVASPVAEEAIRSRLDPQDLGSATQAAFLAWLAERLGTVAGMHDMVFVAPPPGPAEDPPPLVEREDLLDHPRLDRSRLYRRDLRCYSDPEDRALVLVARGLAGRWEMGLEIKPEYRDQGLGRSLILAAARLAPEGEPLFAQVTPGNARSIRAFLAAGYRPIGSEVVFLKRA